MLSGEAFLEGRVVLHAGDCLDALSHMEGCSVDSVVCDPPYHLTSIVKRFGAENAAPAISGKTGAYARASAGFMGKRWDGGDVAFRPETWALVLRVLKPGGHLVAFSGTRTYHRMACAIEDAGFEIRDQIGWAYGSGFPKSHDVSKGIDKRAGAEREVVWHGGIVRRMIPGADQNKSGWRKDSGLFFEPTITAPATDEAVQWQGWGTALKPAWEPIVLARKPLIGTVVENVLAHGTGAINVAACRVSSDGGAGCDGEAFRNREHGRWPANVVHDGSEEVLSAFPAEAGAFAPVRGTEPSRATLNVYGEFKRDGGAFHADAGSAARFFYTAKADAADRIGSKHPTVKPVDLMQWLVRLVTPPGGLVLDPFAGTGTTGEAAFREGMRAVLIEREPEYQADIRRRMALVLAGPDERARESMKASGRAECPSALPLFGGAA